VFAILTISGPHASAQDAANRSDDEVAGRIAFIQRALDEGRKGADAWTYGWLAGYGGATVAQAAIYATSEDQHQRDDMLIGAATSAIGAAGQIVFPLRDGRLAARLRKMPQSTTEERRATLVSAEQFLRRAAADEASGRSWRTQLISIAVNLSSGLIIWLHYDHSGRDGLITFGIGQLVSEAQFFSQPTRAVRNLTEYRQRTDFSALSTRQRRPAWSLALSPGGLTIVRAF
jgi:hypothetical protein